MYKYDDVSIPNNPNLDTHHYSLNYSPHIYHSHPNAMEPSKYQPLINIFFPPQLFF